MHEIINKKKLAATWVLHFFQNNNHNLLEKINLWNQLCIDEPSFINSLWVNIFEEKQTSKQAKTPVCFLSRTIRTSASISTQNILLVLDCNGFNLCENSSEIEKYLPYPGSKWCLEEIETKNQNS